MSLSFPFLLLLTNSFKVEMFNRKSLFQNMMFLQLNPEKKINSKKCKFIEISIKNKHGTFRRFCVKSIN